MKKTCAIRLWTPAILICSVILAASSFRLEAQASKSAAQVSQSAIKALLEKAHTLELHGRMDLAEQTWQQVLLSDPKNAEALAGLARAAKASNSPALANSYLKRLKAINPNDPAVAHIESQSPQPEQKPLQPEQKAPPPQKAQQDQKPPQSDLKPQLEQAAKLSDTGNYAAAMVIYRHLFGAQPPPGDSALAYYETESSTQDGRPHAIAGLRALVAKYPSDSRYQVLLGRTLTYDPPTREEGRKYLTKFPNAPKASQALRQSLLWDAANPAVAPQIRAYLADHHDPQLAAVFQMAQPQQKSSLPAMVEHASTLPPSTPVAKSTAAAPPAATPPPATHEKTSAPPKPSVVVAGSTPPVTTPKPSSAAEKPQIKASPANPVVTAERAQAAAEVAAYQSLNANHIGEAEARFKAILADDPNDPKALAGMGYVRMQQANFSGAVGFLEQAKQNNSTDKGLDSALDTARFWFIMGEGQRSLNDNDLTTAEKRYRAALDLRPNSPEALEGLGGTLAKAQQPLAAIPLYERAVTAAPTSTDAWRGIFMAQVQAGNTSQALATDKRMPPAVHAQLAKDPLFLQALASAQSPVSVSSEPPKPLDTAPKQSLPTVAVSKTESTPSAPIQPTSPPREAEPLLAAQSTVPPASVEIQNAWSLFKMMDDAALYRQLMNLGGRSDLTADQRRTVQTIWASWAVRRANQEAAIENPHRALAILNAAARAFPDNPTAIKALASGYVQAGEPQQAVLIYKAQNMASASAADYESAIGAAFSADDKKDAEIWLRYALKTFPSDPQILIYGAKFEQARGDTAQAMKYYRESLKAMPPVTPGAKSATELNTSAPLPSLSLPSANQPLDLSLLLAPGFNDFTSTGPAPAAHAGSYLPSYSNSPSPAPDSDRKMDGTPQSSVEPPRINPSEQASPAANSTPTSTETYRPYVPYIVPPPPAPPTANPDHKVASSTAVDVQLGNNTPHPAPPQAEMTDILPTARYSQSARANQAAASQSKVAAARAERIRRLQEADTAASRSGQSHPPSEESVTATTQNSESTSQKSSAPQIPRPATQPVGPLSNIPDTGAQQYPQPRTPPATHTPPPAPAATITTPPVVVAPAIPAPQPVPQVAINPHPTSPPTAESYPLFAAPYPLAPPPTDAELMARNLPALRGFYGAQPPITLTPRQQAERDLSTLESSYSSWLGATGVGRYRAGMPGLDRLIDTESPVEASVVIARAIRITAVAVPVFLNSGVLNNYSTSYVPYLGTLPSNSNPPAQQFSNGIGGEVQLTAKNFGIAAGHTPYQFLVSHKTGRLLFRPFGGPLTLFGERQLVKDTQLSYAGLHDPGVSAFGPIWGSVISTTGGVRLDLSRGSSRFYLSADGGILTGEHVLDNTKVEGVAGATFRVGNWSSHGTLTIGGALQGMHYAYNEVGLSYGQGGYFSPNYYFLASAPITYIGHSKSNLHYSVSGSLGVQTFEQDEAPFYPLDPVLQSHFVPSNGIPCTASQPPSYNCGEYPRTVSTLFSYAINAETSYRLADHWYGGGFLTSNNASNYNTVSAGFFFRYVFRAQRSEDGYPAGLFRVEGLRPLQIP